MGREPGSKAIDARMVEAEIVVGLNGGKYKPGREERVSQCPSDRVDKRCRRVLAR